MHVLVRLLFAAREVVTSRSDGEPVNGHLLHQLQQHLLAQDSIKESDHASCSEDIQVLS